MKNFFYAPANATNDAAEIKHFLESFGKVRFAERDHKINSDWVKKLKISEKRPDVELAAVIITAPSESTIIDNICIPVGRGVTDIGQDALFRKVKVFLVMKLGPRYVFYPVIHFNTEEASGNWKLDFSRCYFESPITVDQLAEYCNRPEPPKPAPEPAGQDDDIPF